MAAGYEVLNFHYLLSYREQAAVRAVKKIHFAKYKSHAEDNVNCFVYLADNQTKRVSWSGSTGRLPTFRTGSGKVYHMHSNTWLTSRSKLASLGFPVTESTAAAMGCPIIPVTDIEKADRVAGNAFNFATAAVVQLVLLSCFKVDGD
jgi:hypothetical protein